MGAVVAYASGHRAEASPFGVVYLGFTSLIMFSLAFAKRRVSVDLDNHPLSHEARVTMLDGCLAAGILLALAANQAWGWWWADTLAAAVVGLVAISEGIAAPRAH